MQGMDRLRLDVWNVERHIVRIVNGDTGWVRHGDVTQKMTGEELVAWKRDTYLEAIAIAPLTIRSKGLKYEASADTNVGGKPAAVLRVTGPDGKDFSLYFDKHSGLPVKVTAKLPEFPGGESFREIDLADYKDFDGIRRATRLQFRTNGKIEHVLEVTEFRTLDAVDPKTFAP